MGATCRHATRRDLPDLIASLAAGFDDDPLYRWMYPVDAVRAERLRETFALVLDMGLQRGHTYTNADRTAAAVWTAPDAELLDDEAGREFAGMLDRHLGRRADHVMAGIEMTDRHRPLEPHFGLHLLGVDARVQGRGVGAALVAPVLARCDEDGLLCHLDSSAARNVPFYERLGFAVCAETELPGGGPVMRTMIRRPASG